MESIQFTQVLHVEPIADYARYVGTTTHDWAHNKVLGKAELPYAVRIPHNQGCALRIHAPVQLPEARQDETVLGDDGVARIAWNSLA
jgi:hypothetical protein